MKSLEHEFEITEWQERCEQLSVQAAQLAVALDDRDSRLADEMVKNHHLRAENKQLRDEVVRLDALIDSGVLAEIERLQAAHEAHIMERWCQMCAPDAPW